MKNKIISLLCALLTLLSCLASCDSFGYLDTEGEVRVVIEDGDDFLVYEIDLSEVKVRDRGAMGIIIALSAREENPLTYEASEGPHGAFITEIGSLSDKEADGKNIIVYTSEKNDAYEGSPSIEYDGVTLYQSGVGISEMRMFSGGMLLFRREKYGE